MDFELSEEHRMIQDMVYDFARNEIMPIIKEHDRNHTYPDEFGIVVTRTQIELR